MPLPPAPSPLQLYNNATAFNDIFRTVGDDLLGRGYNCVPDIAANLTGVDYAVSEPRLGAALLRDACLKTMLPQDACTTLLRVPVASWRSCGIHDSLVLGCRYDGSLMGPKHSSRLTPKAPTLLVVSVCRSTVPTLVPLTSAATAATPRTPLLAWSTPTSAPASMAMAATPASWM
jgi:hypothetical protein